MMAASKTALRLMCLLLWKEVHFAQLSVLQQQFITADAGDNVTLLCFDHDNFKCYYWYKQSFGDKPEQILSRTRYNVKTVISEKFKNVPRYSVVSGEGINHLNISDVQLSDSAMYYCGVQIHTDIQFKEGIMLHVKSSSSSIQAILQQPPEKSVQPGDSVNLNCTVHTGGTYHCAVASTRLDDEDCCHQMKILVFLSISRTGVVLCIVLIFTIIYMARKYT